MVSAFKHPSISVTIVTKMPTFQSLSSSVTHALPTQEVLSLLVPTAAPGSAQVDLGNPPVFVTSLYAVTKHWTPLWEESIS